MGGYIVAGEGRAVFHTPPLRVFLAPSLIGIKMILIIEFYPYICDKKLKICWFMIFWVHFKHFKTSNFDVFLHVWRYIDTLKINFPPQFNLQRVKSIPNIMSRDKNYKFCILWGLLQKKSWQNSPKFKFKKNPYNIKNNPFSAYFWKIIYFLEISHNFHIFINFSSLNDEFWKCYILPFKRVELW